MIKVKDNKDEYMLCEECDNVASVIIKTSQSTVILCEECLEKLKEEL